MRNIIQKEKSFQISKQIKQQEVKQGDRSFIHGKGASDGDGREGRGKGHTKNSDMLRVCVNFTQFHNVIIMCCNTVL